MNKQDVQHIIDAKIGSYVLVKDGLARIVGKFHEKYITGSTVADAYVLALEGRQEVGAEERDGEWHLWYSRFSRTCPAGSLENLMGRLKDVETGTIEKVDIEGEIGVSYPEYVFGKKMGKGIFIGIYDGNVDVWLNTSPNDVKVL